MSRFALGLRRVRTAVLLLGLARLLSPVILVPIL